MEFLSRRKVNRSFDLLSRFNHYSPGLGGMVTMLVLMFVGNMAGSLIMMLMSSLFPSVPLDKFANLILYPLMFIPPMLFASVQSMRNSMEAEENPLDNYHFSKGSIWILAISVSIATLALSFTIEPAMTLLPSMPDELKTRMKSLIQGPVWASLVTASVFAPFFEEWLCRGMVLRGLLKRMNPFFSIVISAMFFAFIHMNIWQALPAFAMGCLFGWVYYRTGSLKLTMLMHCVNNTTAIIAGNSEKLKDVEYISDIMSPASYYATFAVCLIILAAVILYISGKKRTR